MTYAQNDALAKLMTNGYNSLQASGVIKTPSVQSLSAVVGQVYTGSNQALTSATATLTNSVNNQVASLVTNASKFGTQLTAQWATGLPPVTNLASNLTNIKGLTTSLTSIPGVPSLGSLTSGVTPSLTSVKTAMDTLGKASQFAASASSTLTSGISNLSNLNLSSLSLSNLSANLPNASALVGQLQGRATALAGQLQGQAANLAGQLQSQLQGQANALLAQAQGRLNSLLSQGDSLVASVQKAAGFANTVNRATVDVAFTKILGSTKIPVPNFGSINSASIGAALDINKAQSVLKNLSGQGTALLSQAQGQLSAAAGQLQTQTAATIAQARTAVTRII